MVEMRNALRILVGNSEAKRPFGIRRSRWKDNIKTDLQEMEYDYVN
jgi:hypothetical protein